MLSEVMLPAQAPQPRLMAGARPVVYPVAPIEVWVFTMIR